MEKVKFGTYEHELVPVGITVNETNKTRSIRFISTLSYNDVINIVSNPDNFESITVIGEDGNTQSTFADCVAFKGLSFDKDIKIDDDTTTDVYTVTYSVDQLERAISDLQIKINNAQLLSDNAVAELTILIASLYGMLA